MKSLDEFYEHATKEDNEPKIQLFRRFKMVIEMTFEDMTIKYYDENEKCHVKIGRVTNPVSALFQPKIAKKFAEDLMRAMGLELIDDDEIPF